MKNFPWFENYPKEVAQSIDLDRYQTVMDIIDECLVKYGDKTAYISMGANMSFSKLDQLSKNFAAYLQSIGLQKGDRIAIMMPNLLQYPIALFGAIRAGLIVVNTNPLYTVREMTHQFNDSSVDALIVLANFAKNVEQALPKTKIKHLIITQIGDQLGGIKSLLVNFVVKYVKKMVPSYHLPQAVDFNYTLSLGAKANYKKPQVNKSDIQFLQYTGGTTGVSKGASLTNGNIIANILQISEWMKPKLKENTETMVTALPLYHIFALTVNCLSMLMIGATNVLIVNPRDMKSFIKDLQKYPFTVMTGVNTLFNGLLNQPDFKALDFSKLKLTVGGGMAVQRAVADKWKQVTGVSLAEGYGLSETSPVLTCNPVDGTERNGTIGVPLPETEVVVMDENGNILEKGQPGEICAKGPQVMKGYWNRDEETAKVFFGEWFRTGDIGVEDEGGFFKIVDRKKDMILVSGFNVYPNEVEDEIAKMDGVLEVAAIGIPDDKSHEAVKVFIVRKDDSLTVEKVRQYCKTCLTGYKVPKHVEFMDELPKTNVGKILRRSLKEMEDKKRKETETAS
ncbi:AMP-binding protein [Chondrinema litorale]|uniref:AMP-binding protein n=1 Tax=Chondrinema litorale TaxID=2994555 RepID=UPI002543D608|nr:AMP-binding protein [Chondrinema litorale]UZR94493.1 AMP-binding protein [Chondrinema litorale]